MTLRTTDADDEALARLARHYGTSKQNAVLYAIRETDARVSGLAEVDRLADQMLEDWGPVFDALANS
jgi:hypothetical protein